MKGGEHMKEPKKLMLFTRKELADYFGISTNTLRKLEHLHPFFNVRPGQHIGATSIAGASNYIRALVSEGRILRNRIKKSALEFTSNDLAI
jgi:hypothetical protein